MGTGILCHAGSALGNTFRGHEDFQMTDNIIMRPDVLRDAHRPLHDVAQSGGSGRLYLAEDMFCSGYVGGECNKGRLISEIV